MDAERERVCESVRMHRVGAYGRSGPKAGARLAGDQVWVWAPLSQPHDDHGMHVYAWGGDKLGRHATHMVPSL